MPNKTLNLAIDGDILELAVVRRMYEMAKKEELDAVPFCFAKFYHPIIEQVFS